MVNENTCVLKRLLSVLTREILEDGIVKANGMHNIHISYRIISQYFRAINDMLFEQYAKCIAQLIMGACGQGIERSSQD